MDKHSMDELGPAEAHRLLPEWDIDSYDDRAFVAALEQSRRKEFAALAEL